MQPKPLKEAVSSIDARTPIGATLRSDQWAGVPLALRQRAQFSARVTSARVLNTIQDRMSGLLSLEREKLANGKTATFDRSSFIDAVRNMAREEGLAPQPGERIAGGLQDITSIPRLGLIYDMQQAQAQGYATWKLDQTAGALLLYPAYEFTRVEEREEERPDWQQRWQEAAVQAADVKALEAFAASGRMIALKNSTLWEKLSIFGTPWPPFDWGSGMGLEDVDRETAEELGLLDKGEIIQGREEGFNEDLRASVRNLSPDILDELKDAFGEQVEIDGDEVVWTNQRKRK